MGAQLYPTRRVSNQDTLDACNNLIPSMKGYPEDIECIIPPSQGVGGIYISNLEAASNLKTLQKHNIKAVITACRGYLLKHSPEDLPYYLYLPADDHESFDISKYFDEAAEFIEGKGKKTNVLVHCMAGISRSVTLVLAYLVKKQGHSTQSAYSLVKKQRRKIYPNSGFIKQLKKLQEKLQKEQRQSSFGTIKKRPSSNISRAYTKGVQSSQSMTLSSLLNSSKMNSFSSSTFNSPYSLQSKTSPSFNPRSTSVSKPLSKICTQSVWDPPSSAQQKSKFSSNIKEYDRRLKQEIKKLQIENMRLQTAIQERQRQKGHRKPMAEIYSGN